MYRTQLHKDDVFRWILQEFTIVDQHLDLAMLLIQPQIDLECLPLTLTIGMDMVTALLDRMAWDVLHSTCLLRSNRRRQEWQGLQ